MKEITMNIDAFTFTPDKSKRNVSEQIAENIENLIDMENVRPGTRLPSERDLAKAFGVTNITVGEALTLLEHRGLIRRKVGSGTFVNAVPHSVIADSIERFWKFNSCTYNDLIFARRSLEPEIAALAAEVASPPEISNLSTLVERMERAFEQKNFADYVGFDVDFHESIAAASHNQLLVAIMNGLYSAIKSWIEKSSSDYRASEDGMRTHRVIFTAIKNHNPEQVRSAMKRHMQVALEIYARIQTK